MLIMGDTCIRHPELDPSEDLKINGRFWPTKTKNFHAVWGILSFYVSCSTQKWKQVTANKIEETTVLKS